MNLLALLIGGGSVAVLILVWFVAGWMANTNATDDHDECHGK